MKCFKCKKETPDNKLFPIRKGGRPCICNDCLSLETKKLWTGLRVKDRELTDTLQNMTGWR